MKQDKYRKANKTIGRRDKKRKMKEDIVHNFCDINLPQGPKPQEGAARWALKFENGELWRKL
jgi:hypothetical protein